MSIKSWKKEFYPMSACVACENEIQAIKHSLRKWRGARKANLERHGLEKIGKTLYGHGKKRWTQLRFFQFNGGTCSLCHLVEKNCPECPLHMLNPDVCKMETGFTMGAYGCHIPWLGASSPWTVFSIMDDPEPMLAPVDLSAFPPFCWEPIPYEVQRHLQSVYGKSLPANSLNAKLSSMKVDWVIVGGESGPKARPMHPGWVRSIRDQCQVAGVPFFFKQWGEYRLVGKKDAGRVLDGRTWDGMP